MIKIYLLIVVVGLVGGAVYGAFYYYKDSQERIRILTENTAKLETAKQLQDDTITAMIEDRERFSVLTKELQTNLDKANNYKDVLIGKLRKHNLAKLSLKEARSSGEKNKCRYEETVQVAGKNIRCCYSYPCCC
ncbi:MAG TPA: hypothetical protein DIT99_07005 [Candidatus Latescibacteria bacterium]|nr:hypothetical protein [Candidatus Latescibacterota bacterium]